MSAGTAKTRELWNANANPIEMFQRLYVRRGVEYEDRVSLRRLYDAYQDFCAERGIAALTQQSFNKHIEENYVKLGSTMIDGEDTRGWEAMRLVEPKQATLKDADDVE